MLSKVRRLCNSCEKVVKAVKLFRILSQHACNVQFLCQFLSLFDLQNCYIELLCLNLDTPLFMVSLF